MYLHLGAVETTHMEVSVDKTAEGQGHSPSPLPPPLQSFLSRDLGLYEANKSRLGRGRVFFEELAAW